MPNHRSVVLIVIGDHVDPERGREMMAYNNQIIALLVVVSLLLSGCESDQAAHVTVPLVNAEPATFAEAVDVLDLMTFPTMTGAGDSITRRANSLWYHLDPDVEFDEILTFQRKAFKDRMWEELPGSTRGEAYAKCTFTRDGFFASTRIQRGKGFVWAVSVTVHGNVDVRALVPADFEPREFQNSPQSAIYVTPVNVAKVAEECRQRFMKQGWEPFGTVSADPEVYNGLFFRQNAVLLAAIICPAWAEDQQGKTRVEIYTRLLPVELPVPRESTRLRYVDTPATTLHFESNQSPEDIVEFYRSALVGSGWTTASGVPVEVDSGCEIVFSNPADDMLTVSLSHTVSDEALHVTIIHQTSSELENAP